MLPGWGCRDRVTNPNFRNCAVRYVSTRGTAPVLEFEDVLLTGLARDGGLYVPEAWPRLTSNELRGMHGCSYAEIGARVMAPFVGSFMPEEDFKALVVETYAGFRHAEVAPLEQLDDGLWIMELFHGPTLAFKDYALQFVGRLFDRVLSRRQRRMTIIGATSGDTGSAAIESCRDSTSVDVVILHPHGRTSDVQRRQMTTVDSANVHNLAIEGTFDDCQELVKSMLSDVEFCEEMGLGAINSINWARILAQIVYYVAAAVALGAPDRRVSFAVPTGNFGNVYAAYCARKMGLPISRLISGSNRNDILCRFFKQGTLRAGPVYPTLSPSMDIQVPSNFERFLFDLDGRNAELVRNELARFREQGELKVDDAGWHQACELFSGHRVDDSETLATIGEVYRASGQLIDPHTAVGVTAARAQRGDLAVPMVALACAHPAKFPDPVERATGVRPVLPDHLSDLFDRKEQFTVLPNDLGAVREFVRGNSRREAA